MFNKQDDKSEMKGAETIIGPSVKIKGDFVSQGNIIVEGIVEGGLKTANSLQIGNKAKVIANIEAKDAIIGGEVIGNIKVSGHLEISSSAKIMGDIEVSSLEIATGAILNGKCVMNGKDGSAKHQAIK